LLAPAKACPPGDLAAWTRRRGTVMIVISIDPHMKTRTAVALCAATGARMGERTAACDAEAHDTLLLWARSLGEERIFAVEDCRHVSGSIERFLLPASGAFGTRARGAAAGRLPRRPRGGARTHPEAASLELP